MPADPIDTPAQAAVVGQLIGRASGTLREVLAAACHDVSSDRLAAAIESLEREGLVEVSGRTIQASRALKRLDALGMVCV